jgi:hypothetical protein
MQPKQTFRPYLNSTIILILFGWGGLALMIVGTTTPPYVWARWMFFVLFVMGLTGLALPLSFYLNRRFPTDPPAQPAVIIREALWVGVSMAQPWHGSNWGALLPFM